MKIPALCINQRINTECIAKDLEDNVTICNLALKYTNAFAAFFYLVTSKDPEISLELLTSNIFHTEVFNFA